MVDSSEYGAVFGAALQACHSLQVSEKVILAYLKTSDQTQMPYWLGLSAYTCVSGSSRLVSPHAYRSIPARQTRSQIRAGYYTETLGSIKWVQILEQLSRYVSSSWRNTLKECNVTQNLYFRSPSFEHSQITISTLKMVATFSFGKLVTAQQNICCHIADNYNIKCNTF